MHGWSKRRFLRYIVCERPETGNGIPAIHDRVRGWPMSIISGCRESDGNSALGCHCQPTSDVQISTSRTMQQRRTVTVVVALHAFGLGLCLCTKNCVPACVWSTVVYRFLLGLVVCRMLNSAQYACSLYAYITGRLERLLSCTISISTPNRPLLTQNNWIKF